MDHGADPPFAGRQLTELNDGGGTVLVPSPRNGCSCDARSRTGSANIVAVPTPAVRPLAHTSTLPHPYRHLARDGLAPYRTCPKCLRISRQRDVVCCCVFDPSRCWNDEGRMDEIDRKVRPRRTAGS